MKSHRDHHERELFGALCVVVLALVFVVWARPGLAETAHAASRDPGLLLSTDQRHWSSSLTEPLFDPAHQWAPGETGARVIYVRNDSPSASRVQVSVGMRGTQGGEAASWAVVSSRMDGQAWTSMQEPDSTTLLRGLPLQPGEVRRLELRATVDTLAPESSMARELQIDVDVRPDTTIGVRAGTAWKGWSLSSDVRSRLVAATVGGLLAFLGLGVVRRRRAEELA